MKRSVVFLALLAFAAPALAGNAVITWSNPTTYSDGAPMPATEIAHTVIERGTCAGPDTFGTLLSSAQAPGLAVTYTDAGLAPGTYCWRLATVTIRGKTSDYSATKSKVIDWPTPSAPTGVDVVVSFSFATPGGIVEVPAGETLLVPGLGIIDGRNGS